MHLKETLHESETFRENGWGFIYRCKTSDLDVDQKEEGEYFFLRFGEKETYQKNATDATLAVLPPVSLRG